MTTNAVSIVIVMIIITVMSDVVDRAMYFYEHFELRAGTNQSLQSQGDDEEEVEEENELLGVWGWKDNSSHHHVIVVVVIALMSRLCRENSIR